MPPRFQEILLPTDFSPLAALAAQYARSLAETYGGVVHVLHVATAAAPAPPLPGATGTAPQPAPLPEAASARQRMAEFVDEAFDTGDVAVHTLVELGTPAERICAYAKTHAVDAIVIGTHGTGVLTRLAVGSVSKSVVEGAPCPVLMVPAPDAACRDSESAPSSD